MTFAFAVRTMKARPIYYEQFIERFKSLVAPDPRVLGIATSEGTGILPNENACGALEDAARIGAEWVLFFEDDAEFIDDIIGSTERWLTKNARPDVRFYPLGCNYSQCFRPGMTCMVYPIESFYGTVGVALRTPDAAAFAAWLRKNIDHPNKQGQYPTTPIGKCLDLRLATWHKVVEPKQPFVLTPAPCFINHMGRVSTISTEAGHYTGEYAGYGGRSYQYHG